MEFTEFLKPQLIRTKAVVSSKKRALEVIGQLCADYINALLQQNDASAKSSDVCPVEYFHCLFKREKLGSTCLNNGVAFPHAKLPVCEKFTKPLAIFLQLETPVDYNASDNREVDLIFAMLFPEGHCEPYKAALPEFAQKLSDKVLLKQLRAASSNEEIWAIFERVDHKREQTETNATGSPVT